MISKNVHPNIKNLEPKIQFYHGKDVKTEVMLSDINKRKIIFLENKYFQSKRQVTFRT